MQKKKIKLNKHFLDQCFNYLDYDKQCIFTQSHVQNQYTLKYLLKVRGPYFSMV